MRRIPAPSFKSGSRPAICARYRLRRPRAFSRCACAQSLVAAAVRLARTIPTASPSICILVRAAAPQEWRRRRGTPLQGVVGDGVRGHQIQGGQPGSYRVPDALRAAPGRWEAFYVLGSRLRYSAALAALGHQMASAAACGTRGRGDVEWSCFLPDCPAGGAGARNRRIKREQPNCCVILCC